MNYPVTEVLWKLDEFKNINLLLNNYEEGMKLLFNGFGFERIPPEHWQVSGFTPLMDFTNGSLSGTTEVLALKQDGDVYYLEFNDGTIIQLYRTMDDESKPQKLSVFKPGEPNYSSASERLKNSEEWSFDFDGI